MASNFHIQQPYLLATLPKPSGPAQSPRRCTAGEVFGQRPDSKKRKRSELAVGIDGDAVNLYDVPSSRLVTSYPIPPQYFFNCPPCSVRWKGKQVVRCTYVCTEDGLSSARRVTLFKDVVGSSGDTQSTSTWQALRHKQPIVYATTVPFSSSSDSTGLDLLAVTRDGTIVCLDGDTLQEKWSAPASTFSQGATQVDLAQACLSTDVMAGFFNGKPDAFGVFPRAIEPDGFNPDVLLVVTSDTRSRHLHVLAIAPRDHSHRQHVIPVASYAIPQPTTSKDAPVFRLDVESGCLEELRRGTLRTYVLDQDVPRMAHSLTVPDTMSFLRLSSSSVLTATLSVLGVYSPALRSLQASTATNVDSTHDDGFSPLELVTYFKRLEVAVALAGRRLVTIQLEAPKTRKRKRRIQGLLIDSIGRGLPQAVEPHKWPRAGHSASTLAGYLPGTLTASYWKEWTGETKRADGLLNAGDVGAWESLLAAQFGLDDSKTPWEWPEAGFRPVDRRWVLYAIARVFSLESTLSLRLPDATNVVHYLVAAGHLSVSNLKSAFHKARDTDDLDALLGEQTPRLLAETDPTLDLLVGYLSATRLGAVELLASIRQIMASLDLVQDARQKLVNGDDGDEEAAIDSLERDLEVTEHHLLGGDTSSSTRERGFAMALGLLASCPATDTVRAMQRLFRPEETLSLIHVLRLEMVRGGWTTRYLDTSYLDDSDTETQPPSDSSIRLLADLLSRCIDAVGPSGWVVNGGALTTTTTTTAGPLDTTDLLAALKLEVSAALEGIQEAVYLRGVLTEAVRYMTGAQAAAPEKSRLTDSGVERPEKKSLPRTVRPVAIRAARSPMLPLGASHRGRVPQEKVDAGGEVTQRSRREQGYLGSQRVGAYTLERIVL